MSDEELQLIPIEELRRLVRLGPMVDSLRHEGLFKPALSQPEQGEPAEAAYAIRTYVNAAKLAVESLAQQILLSEPMSGADFARDTARAWYGIAE